MAKRIMLEVTQPYHPDGKTVVYSPGDLFELDAELPDGLLVKEVIADVPEPKPKARAEAGAELKAAVAKAEARPAAPAKAEAKGAAKK